MEAKLEILTDPALANALKDAKLAWGQIWKAKLRKCWETGRYPIKMDIPALQRVRNLIGPKGLEKLK